MKNQNLEALHAVGQSIWYDNLSRDVLNSGELKKLIDSGVRGLTSNPTIFKKAIADSSNYDAAMKSLMQKGTVDVESITEALMVEDVGAAADLLLPVYNESSGHDGCASIEVSPFLAHNTQKTLDAARRLWSSLKRPNIMIKVPATKEGIPAVKTLLAEGINVNITLIFSVSVYEHVANAYIEALEERAAKGLPIDKMASVASFFVSRVDSISELKMEDLVKSGKWNEDTRKKYFGQIGIANSRVAYKKFLDLFGGDRFKKLAAKGAAVQRPLWASTGTKNPVFSPVMYVEELAGKDTVNTVPPQTLKSLMDKVAVSDKLSGGIAQAASLLKDFTSDGVPFEDLLLELQVQGVKLFADSFTELLDSVSQKLKKV